MTMRMTSSYNGEEDVILKTSESNSEEAFELQPTNKRQEISTQGGSNTDDWDCIHCTHINYGGKFCNACGVPKPNAKIPLKTNIGYDPLASENNIEEDRNPCEISCRYEAQRGGCKGKFSSRNPCPYLHEEDSRFNILDAEKKLEDWYEKQDKLTQERIVCMLREQPDGLTTRDIYKLYRQKFREEVYYPRKYRNFEQFILGDDRVKHDWFINLRENVYSCKRGY